MYSPWEYFFVPEITGLQSYVRFVTPWNVLTYDLNLWLFGLKPELHYLMQLIMLWITGIATYLFLLRWCSKKWALFGSALFLTGGASAYIVQELMDAHYILGLLFSILVIHFYLHGIKSKNYWYIILSSIFYLFSASCKEIYVPIIGILPFLPSPIFDQRKRDKILYLAPFLLIFIFYICWRYYVLGEQIFGGYNQGSNLLYDINTYLEVIKNLFNVPFVLLGSNPLSLSINILILTLTITYLIKYNKKYFILLLVSLTLLFLPLIAVHNKLNDFGRYMFLPWWLYSIHISILLSNCQISKHIKNLFGLLLLIVVLFLTYHEIHNVILNGKHKRGDVISNFILNSNSEQILFNGSILAVNLIEAERMIESKPNGRAKIVSDIFQLNEKDLIQKEIFSYDKNCKCMVKINKTISNSIVNNHKQALDKKLNVKLIYRKPFLTWELGPYIKGKYVFHVNINNLNTVTLNDNFFGVPLGKQGRIGLRSNTELRFYVNYNSPNGWFIRSEILTLLLLDNNSLEWTNGYN